MRPIRESKLDAYFLPHVQFDPLLRQDASARLQRLREISLFQIRIRTAYAQELMNAGRDLFQAFEAARRLTNAPRGRCSALRSDTGTVRP